MRRGTQLSRAGGSALSVVIPVLNEAPGIVSALAALQGLRTGGVELVLVDGGSADDTPVLAQPLVDRAISSPPGRGRQLCAGVRESSGAVVVFLHCDTRLPGDHRFLDAVGSLLSNPGWGFFDVALSGDEWWTRIISWFINRRSRLTGICTGDQVLFVNRELLDLAGGVPDIPLMEDVALAKSLRAVVGRPRNPRLTVTTSSRRWRRDGVVKTVLLMWRLRLSYFLGLSPDKLARRYYR